MGHITIQIGQVVSTIPLDDVKAKKVADIIYNLVADGSPELGMRQKPEVAHTVQERLDLVLESILHAAVQRAKQHRSLVLRQAQENSIAAEIASLDLKENKANGNRNNTTTVRSSAEAIPGRKGEKLTPGGRPYGPRPNFERRGRRAPAPAGGVEDSAAVAGTDPA